MADGTTADTATPHTDIPSNTPADTSARPGARAGASDAQAAPTLNQIRYPCLMNMDYHATREGWLDGVHRWLMFLVIAAGAAAFIDAWPVMRIIGPIVSVVCGSLDLTFDLSNRARTHAMFRRRYGELLSEAARNADALHGVQCKLDEPGGEEEPAYHAQLALSAMKAQHAVYGRIVAPCRPGFWYRRFANIVRFDGHDFNAA